MSDKSSFHVELPDNLKGKFRSLERKLWLVDTAIAASGLAAGLVCFYLLLFISDRFWDTPATVRLLFTGAGIAVAAWYGWFWINHWIINRRDNRVLAAIVQQKHRRMGDHLMSAVELTDGDERPDNVSEVLCRAAIDQIANESERFSFNQAVATRKPFLLTLLAIFVLGLLSLPVTYTADAGISSAKRANPFSSEDRYTFIENGGLTVNGRKPIKGTFYVARGDAIQLNSKFTFADAENVKDGRPFWETLGNVYANTHGTLQKWDTSIEGSMDVGLANSFSSVIGDPNQAKLTGLKKPRFAKMKDGSVEYTLPGRSKSFDLTLRVGDARRPNITIQPLSRPELGNTTAVVKYPNYLYYPEAELEIRGTVFSYLEGSTVKFAGQLQEDSLHQRTLSKVEALATHAIKSDLQKQGTFHDGNNLWTEFMDLDNFVEMDITWADQYHIANSEKAPWKLLFERRTDELPYHVECLDIAPEIAILRSEVESIRMVGEDDYALRELSVEWYCWKRDGINLVKKGTAMLVRKGKYLEVLKKYEADLKVYETAVKADPEASHPIPVKPDPLKGEGTFLFNPGDGALEIPEGTYVDIYAIAKDYYPNDRKARSLPVRIHVLSPEVHAQLIQQNFESKMAELDDLVRREENLENATRETGEMNPEELSNEQTEKQIERQKQEQDSIADKLKQLAKEVEELAKEALKNPEMDPTDVAKMAEMAQQMKDAAAKEMAAAQAALQLTIDQEQDRQENLADAAKKEKEAKEKLKELQDKAEETAQAMYANTLVKRLRQIAKFEESIAEDFKKHTAAMIGRFLDALPDDLRTMVNNAYGYQGIYSLRAARLQEEIAAFYDATDDEKFGKVTSDMANYKPAEKMDESAKDILKVFIGPTIKNTTELAAKFNEWADILDPKDESEPGEGEGQPGEPDEDLIARLKELLRLRQAEMDLREKTLNLDAEAGVKDKAQIEDDAFGLQFRQLELLGDLQKERDVRGDGKFLPAAQFRMRDAEDELNLQGDEEGLAEAYKWALMAKANKGGAKIDATLKALGAKLTDKQRKRAEAKAKAIQDSDK